MMSQFISDQLASGDPKMAPIRLPLNINRVGVKPEVKSEVKGTVGKQESYCCMEIIVFISLLFKAAVHIYAVLCHLITTIRQHG